MAAHSPKKCLTFTASGAILKNSFVKFGSTKDLVAQCGANERAIGIFVSHADAASGDSVDICLPGGGASLKVNETVALGKMITSTSTGIGEVADAAGEWVGAIAYESGVQNDVIGVEVVALQAYASDA